MSGGRRNLSYLGSKAPCSQTLAAPQGTICFSLAVPNAFVIPTNTLN